MQMNVLFLDKGRDSANVNFEYLGKQIRLIGQKVS